MKICGDNVRLRFVKAPLIVDDTECLGCAEIEDNIIKIIKDLAPREAARTLIHEVIEVINYRLGVDLKHRQIEALENGLGDFLFDNSKIDWRDIYAGNSGRRRIHQKK